MALSPSEGRWRLAIRWLMAVLALSFLVPAAAATPGPSSTVLFGVVDGRLLDGDAAQIAADLAQDASVGVTAVRVQLSWNAVEPKPGSYDWAEFDEVVAGAAAHHMTVLGLIDFTPAWARAAGCLRWTCPPADPSQFAGFASMAAARYGSQVAAWEIWNEPNTSSFWYPAPNPSAYSKLLSLAAVAIHTAAPGALVVSGGLSPVDDDNGEIDAPSFLATVCADGGLASVDAVGDHPYSFPVPPDYPADWNGWQQMADTSTSLRSVMSGCGAGQLPIWITEYGAPTNGPGVAASPANYYLAAHPNHVTPALQAEMMTQAVTDARSYGWVGAVFLYSATDAGTVATTNQNFFGLSNHAGAPKPAWYALRSAIAND